MSSTTESLPARPVIEPPSARMRKRSKAGVVRRAGWPLWQVAALTAVISTIGFFLPLVAALEPSAARWPAFMLTGDQRMVYFPSFIEGYRRFWHGGLLGLDFLTQDGASIFAYRPNLMPFYPPYLLAYLVTDCSNLTKGVLAYLTITISHLFLGLFFTVVFIKRYLALPTGAAVLGAVLYTINSYTSAYTGEATFYFQIMMLPVLACSICWLARTPSVFAPVWMAPVFTTYALSNYGPMMLAGLGYAVLAALVSVAILPKQAGRQPWRTLGRPAASVVIAALSTAAYFVAQMRYKDLLTPSVDDINSVAHVMALSGYDLLNAVSQFLDFRRTRFEALLVWGAIPTFLALVGLHVVVMHKTEIRARYLLAAGACAGIYLMTLLPVFGRALLPATDLFYYGAPVLGKMHIYQRYLLFAQFFFAVAIAALTTIAIVHATPKIRMAVSYAGILVWLGITTACLLWPTTGPTDTSSLLLEMFLVAVTGIAVAVSSPKPAFLLIALLAGIIGASTFYTLPPALNRAEQWTREPDPLGAETEAIVAFVKANSAGRALSKFVIASTEIEPYFNRNLPWLLGDKVKMMNFQGYPGHLSVLADYSPSWQTYGEFDLPWLHQAGIDFVFWSDSSGGPLASLLNGGFKFGALMTLKGGHHIARLVRSDNAPTQHEENVLFDNGMLRVVGQGAAVKNFETDYTRKIRLDLNVTEPCTVTYLLWPNPYMVPFVDGRHVAWSDPNSKPLKIDVGPGQHSVEVRFISPLGSVFLFSQLILALLAVASLVLEFTYVRLPDPLGRTIRDLRLRILTYIKFG